MDAPSYPAWTKALDAMWHTYADVTKGDPIGTTASFTWPHFVVENERAAMSAALANAMPHLLAAGFLATTPDTPKEA